MSAQGAAAPSVSLEVEGGVAVLTLNRPPLNVLTIATMKEIVRELAALHGAADLRCLLLRGTGKCFCAGVDVGEHEGPSAATMPIPTPRPRRSSSTTTGRT